MLVENLLIDPSVCEFWDYKDSPWLGQVIPMRRSEAEAKYNVKLDKAKAYDEASQMPSSSRSDRRLASADAGQLEEDKQIAIFEIWDKVTHRIYTLAEGCDFFLREPYSPERLGERWYPFFILPFQIVDGQFVGPSLVDLTEKLQHEHNSARDNYNRHRDLCQPGWVASSDVSEKSIRRFSDSELGEVTLIDTEGKPLAQVITPRQHPPIDPLVYDTTPIRYDWEQVTGMQDAARSSVVNPKTATEASIMQQALSGRVSEFRDQVEDWLQEIAQYSSEMLIMELTKQQVERITGPNEMTATIVNGMPTMVPLVKRYDWPELTREEVFDLVEIKIRAGSTGSPDRLELQENWAKVLPIVQGLVTAIMQAQAQGVDAEPLINLLRETIQRFDDKVDAELFIPKPPQPMGMPGMLPGMGATGLPPGVNMVPASGSPQNFTPATTQ